MTNKLLTSTIIGGAAVAGGVLALNNSANDETPVKESATDVTKSTSDNSGSKSNSKLDDQDVFGTIVTPDFAPNESENAKAEAVENTTPAQEYALESSQEVEAETEEVATEKAADAQSVSEKSEKATSSSSKKTAEKKSESKETSKPKKQTTYVVESNDTLSAIAERFNIDVNDLMAWNGNTSLIYSGQEISLVEPKDKNNQEQNKKDEETVNTPAQDLNQKEEEKTPAPAAPTPAPEAPKDEEKAPAAPAPEVPANPRVDNAANIAVAQELTTMDIPYVWAGATPEEGMDCSGLTQYVYQNGSGIYLPHNTVMQEAYFSNKPVDQAQAGDLLFWGETGATYHVGIYIGNGQYIDAAKPGTNVDVGNVADYQPSFAGSYIGE